MPVDSIPLPHGGHLRAAAARYAIPLAEWLDLSTGINPNGWPAPALPPTVWNRLPEEEDGLEAAARDYYRADSLLAVAGSQAAIQLLPKLREPGRVAIIHPGYREHYRAWQRACHAVSPISADEIEPVSERVEHMLLIHPNNPGGECFTREQLLRCHARLRQRDGWLVVDEAFIDCAPEHSLAPFSDRPGLIVLRSLGKFFGLAGARVGFVCAQAAILKALKSELGPWPIAAPSRHVATLALRDNDWQQAARAALPSAGERLRELLSRHGLVPNGGGCLFQWVETERAGELHEQLARRAILTRLFDAPASLRFGLPGDESGWRHLDEALGAVR